MACLALHALASAASVDFVFVYNCRVSAVYAFGMLSVRPAGSYTAMMLRTLGSIVHTRFYHVHAAPSSVARGGGTRPLEAAGGAQSFEVRACFEMAMRTLSVKPTNVE